MVEMRQDRDRFTLARSLEHLFNREVFENDVKWWFNQRSRCMTYSKHFSSPNCEKDMEKRVSPSMLELLDDATHYPWLSEELLEI